MRRGFSIKAFVRLSRWTNKEKNNPYLVTPSKVTLVFEDFPMLDTTSGAALVLRFSEVQTKQAIKWRSHAQRRVLRGVHCGGRQAGKRMDSNLGAKFRAR